MDYDHTEFEHCGFKCVIAYDSDTESPDEWSNEDAFLGEIEHGRYSKMGREGETAAEARRCIPWGEGPWEWSPDANGTLGCDMDTWFDDELEMRQVWEVDHHTGYEVFPVQLTDHGSQGAVLNPCDHGEANGYIFVKVPWSSELERLAHPDHNSKRIADSIVEEWNTYLSGDVHWARIEDSDGENIESCGSFYGHESAEEWCRDTAEGWKDDTRPVTVVVTRGTLPLPLPTTVSGQIHPIAVPLQVGIESIGKWAVTEGPFKNDKDVVQVNLYSPVKDSND